MAERAEIVIAGPRTKNGASVLLALCQRVDQDTANEAE